MSGDLTWLLIKNNNSFLVKRNGVEFSREKGNLYNKNSYKYSGICNNETIDVSSSDKAVVITTRSRRFGPNMPKKSVVTTTTGRDGRRVAKTVTGLTLNNFYRRDLTKAAVARATTIVANKKQRKNLANRIRKPRK